MQPNIRTNGDVSIIDLPGRVTHGAGDVEMREMILHLLDEGKRKFIVNLDKVTFMDSAALGELVACHKRAVDKSGTIKLLKANEKMLDLFTITRLNSIFELYDDEKEALDSFKSS